MKKILREAFVILIIGILGSSATLLAREPFVPGKLEEIDTTINEAIAKRKLPGAVFWLESDGQSYQRVYGHRMVAPIKEDLAEDTIFDAASLTKVIATTPAIMVLVQRGSVKLDEPVKTYLQEFQGDGRDSITVRHLLAHTSGLTPGFDPKLVWEGYAGAIQMACLERPGSSPGTKIRYSDVNFILLGEIVQRVSQMQLNHFVIREIYRPLQMWDTGYLPSAKKRALVAPTERGLHQGIVHDPTARKMGGVAGHAGVFTTATNLARFARMLLNDGELSGVRIFKPETVQLMIQTHTPDSLTQKRGLGWDIDTGFSHPRGALFPIGSYGHTGFTGTSIWIDPFSKTFWILLSSRLHPNGSGNIMTLQRELGTLSAEAITHFDFQHLKPVNHSVATD
ncbi:MAG: beta-lactamase family protein [Verrucomicrobia bacterium]|nr:beta-lactamase family protein [Verrucomicrobiota bacterium]